MGWKAWVENSNIERILAFPRFTPEEMKEVRTRNNISLSRMEHYIGVQRETISKMERGYPVTDSILNIYSVAIERLIMFEKGCAPGYRKYGTNEFI